MTGWSAFVIPNFSVRLRRKGNLPTEWLGSHGSDDRAALYTAFRVDVPDAHASGLHGFVALRISRWSSGYAGWRVSRHQPRHFFFSLLFFASVCLLTCICPLFLMIPRSRPFFPPCNRNHEKSDDYDVYRGNGKVTIFGVRTFGPHFETQGSIFLALLAFAVRSTCLQTIPDLTSSPSYVEREPRNG